MEDESILKVILEAREEANYYITHDAERMKKEDLYDFYEIGELYRDEYRNEWL